MRNVRRAVAIALVALLVASVFAAALAGRGDAADRAPTSSARPVTPAASHAASPAPGPVTAITGTAVTKAAITLDSADHDTADHDTADHDTADHDTE